MKRNSHDEIRWKNPWKVFKQGSLPIGLAIAYKEKHGYDPLKACRLFLWLKHIRGFTLQFGFILVAMVFLSIPVPSQYDSFKIKSTVQNIGSYYFLLLFGLILFNIFTRNIYKKSKSRMWEFKNAVESFISHFSFMFGYESPPIDAYMGKNELLAKVKDDMINVARTILVGEISGSDITPEQRLLRQKSSTACEFGLSNDPSTYLDEVRGNMNKYEHFAWEI